jgi:hypothetical protein
MADGTDGADAFSGLVAYARVGRQTENGVSAVSGVMPPPRKTGASGFGNWRNPDLCSSRAKRTDDLT